MIYAHHSRPDRHSGNVSTRDDLLASHVILKGDAFSETVDRQSVTGNSKRRGLDRRWKSRRRLGQGLRHNSGNRVQRLSGAEYRVEKHEFFRRHNYGTAVDAERYADGRISQRKRLLSVVRQIDDRQGVLLRGGRSEISEMDYDQVLSVRRHRQRTRLRGHIDRPLDRIIGQGHHVNAVRGEVGDVQDASPLV